MVDFLLWEERRERSFPSKEEGLEKRTCWEFQKKNLPLLARSIPSPSLTHFWFWSGFGISLEAEITLSGYLSYGSILIPSYNVLKQVFI